MTSLLLVSTIMLQAALADQSIACFEDDQKCQVANGNLIEMQVETTWQECSVLCQNEPTCLVFNFFGPDSNFHPHNACLLFSECENKVPCQDCLLGTREQPCTCTSQRHCPCSIEFEGSVDNDNYVDIAAEVQSEGACKNLCSEAPECAVYTYYNNQDPYQPEMCMMLSSSGLLKSASKCANCKTGLATCQSGPRTCEVAVLTDDAASTLPLPLLARSTTTATLVSAEKDCFLDVRALAIGGGGQGGSSTYRGGGGSGYPEVGVVQLRVNETLNLVVGGDKEASMVGKNDQVLFIASAGQSTNDYTGGNGYSGGGAMGEYGGSDGSDGGDHTDGHGDLQRGGKGSGLDLRTLNMTKFALTPGKAGREQNGHGGGGGGILVNGEGPGIDGFGGGGEGFGAGNYGGHNGAPGCVLIEV